MSRLIIILNIPKHNGIYLKLNNISISHKPNVWNIKSSDYVMYNCVRFDGLDIQNGIIVKRLVSPPEHRSWPGFKWGSCCSVFFLLCSVLFIALCPFVLFHLAIVLSDLLWFTVYDYPFGILWTLCCLCFLDLRFMITPLVS
jgi:hypothetical protein